MEAQTLLAQLAVIDSKLKKLVSELRKIDDEYKNCPSDENVKILKGKQVIIQEELEIARDDLLSTKQLLDSMLK